VQQRLSGRVAENRGAMDSQIRAAGSGKRKIKEGLKTALEVIIWKKF
jgi:hypothetical protein